MTRKFALELSRDGACVPAGRRAGAEETYDDKKGGPP